MRERHLNRDSYGLPLTTGSDSAAAFYRDGVELLLSAWCGSEQAFDKAISEDPGFALAHIARARVHQLHMEIAEARTMAALARELATIATRRERQHVAILAAAIEGKPKDALTGAEQHLDEFPCDALVFGLLLGAFGLYAFSGRADHDAARLAICGRHARHYGEDWWFLTYLGWSHTEAGNVRAGRTITERAIAIRPQNGNAAHALSHAHFEQGDALAGDAFLSEWLLAHDGKSYLQGHLSWHVALVAVESGDADRALKTYNERIRPSEARYPPLNVFTDCASLLWRLTLSDKTVPASQWKQPNMETDSSRGRGHTSPISIMLWWRRQRTAIRWRQDWRSWNRLRLAAVWRRVRPQSIFAAAPRHLPSAIMTRPPTCLRLPCLPLCRSGAAMPSASYGKIR